MKARPGVLRASEQTLGEGATAHLASAGDSLAAAAAAALADLDGVPDGMPGLARPNRPATPPNAATPLPKPGGTNPGSPTPPSPSGSRSAAEPSSATPRPSRSGASSAAPGTAATEANGPGHITPPSTGGSSPGWPTNSGGPPPRRISAATSSPAGSPGGRASAATVAGDYRRRRCGWNAAPCANLSATPAAPSWPPACAPPGCRHPLRRPSHSPSTSGCSLSPT
jgi:hypothetical protein